MKREKLWNDGIWKVDESLGCHCCYNYWNDRCHASGKRFKQGYCNSFQKKSRENYLTAQERYDNYMKMWN